jgi:hypothetical protein
MFYNTNNEIGTELKKSQEKAKSQDELILIYFRNHDQLGVTPERVLSDTSESWSRYHLTDGQTLRLHPSEGRFRTSTSEA